MPACEHGKASASGVCEHDVSKSEGTSVWMRAVSSLKDVRAVDQELKWCQDRTRELSARKKEILQAQEHLRDLASLLHDMRCKLSHTDQCSWGYENDPRRDGGPWAQPTHQWWLALAEKALRDTKLDPEDIARAHRIVDEIGHIGV